MTEFVEKDIKSSMTDNTTYIQKDRQKHKCDEERNGREKRAKYNF